MYNQSSYEVISVLIICKRNIQVFVALAHIDVGYFVAHNVLWHEIILQATS